jgi:DNA-binding transcriptional LysR family regulator
MELNLRQVGYALALADELSFTRAAASLHITQQTLSAQIAALERRLGVDLFVRDRQRVELTEPGRIFVEHGRNLLASATDMVAAVTTATEPIRIDVITEGLVSGELAAELRGRLVDLAFEVQQRQGLSASLPAVQSGATDLAIGNVRGQKGGLPAGLASTALCWQEIGVLVPDSHPLAPQESITVEDLREWPILIHTASEAPEWEAWNELFIRRFALTVGHRLHGHGRAAAGAAVLAHGEPSPAPLGVPVPAGAVLRPLVGPVPLCEFALVWRAAAEKSTRLLPVLREIASIVGENEWLKPPEQPWWMP